MGGGDSEATWVTSPHSTSGTKRFRLSTIACRPFSDTRLLYFKFSCRGALLRCFWKLREMACNV